MADIYLDIGVNGGASLTGASGAAIERDITAIVRAIEQNVTTRLEFRADETALNNMVNQIEAAFRNANISIDTTGIEAQLREATNNIRVATGVASANTNASTTQGEIREVERLTNSVENLNAAQRRTYDTIQRQVAAVREYLSLIQITNRTEEENERLSNARASIGRYAGGFSRSGSTYSDRYNGVDSQEGRIEVTRQVVLDRAQQFFTENNLINELQELQNNFALEAAEAARGIGNGTDSIVDAIERQGDEVEESTDETAQQIEEGTQRLIGAYEDRAAALTEVTRRVSELTSGRDAQYELVDIDYRRNNEAITQQSVRSRDRASGNIFTNRYNLDENEDGSFDIRLVSNESNRQVQNYLNGVIDKLDTIRHKRDQIVDDKNTGQLAAGLTKGLDSAIAEVGILEQAVRRAVETGDYSQFQRDTFLGGRYNNVTNIDTAMNAIDRAMEDAQYSMKGFTSEVNKAYKESNNLVATYSKIASIRSRVNGSDDRYNTGAGSTYDQVVQDLKMIDELKAKIDATGKTLATDNFSAGAKNAEKYTNELRELYDIVVKLEYHTQQLEQDSSNLSDSYIKSQTNDFKRNYETFIKSPVAYNVDSELFDDTGVKSLYSNILLAEEATKNAEINYQKFGETAEKANKKVRDSIDLIINSNSRLSTANQKLTTEERRKNNVMTQTHKTYSEALRYYKEHESGIKKNIDLDKKWAKVLSDIHSGRFGDDIGGMRTALSELQTETKDAGAETQTLHSQLKKLFHDHFGSVAATTIIGAIGDILRNAYTRVLDIDKAMTELRKVTDLTEESYEKFGETAARVAREVGGTIADTINATADFARLGFNVNEATELAKAAMIYKNVGDGIEDISQASESIISTIKGFGLEANDAMGIIDKFNEVGNKYAIDSVGIGEALKRSAAALSAANNTLDESIALATAANNVIQDPDVVGTALKTMSMFLRAAKTEAEEAGIETEGMANSVSELREEVKQLTGVDIMIDDSTFKSTFQILQDISKVWDELADVDQANIAEMLVGKRQANIFFSLVENFEEAENVLKTSLNSAGSAAEENEKYLASIEGRIQSLLISFEKLSTGILDSDLVKGAIEFLTNVVNILNSINDWGGGDGVAILASVAGLSTLFSRSGGFGFETLVDEKGLTYLTLFGEKLTVLGDKADRAKAQIEKADLGTAIKDWANHFFLGYKSTTDIKAEMDALEEYSSQLHKVATSGGDVGEFVHNSLFSDESTLKIKNADLATRDFANTLTKCAGDSDALNKEIKDYGVKLETANKKTSLGTSLVKKFGAAFANIGSAIAGTLVLFAINAVIDGIVKLVDYLHTTEEEAEEARQALVTAAQDSASELKTISDELDNIRQKIDNVNEGKIELTNDETLEKLKAQESSLENQYIWLTRIDEYNKRNAYQATESKILATDKEIPQELRDTPVGDSLPGLFGTTSSTQLASSIIEAITWYRTELSNFQVGGLNDEELLLFDKYNTSVGTLQKKLNEIFTEWQGYFSEGTIQYSTDPSSVYQIITKIQEKANKEDSLASIGNSQAYQNYVEFLDMWKLEVSNMLDEISVSGIESESTAFYRDTIISNTINPVTGDMETTTLGEEYTQKLFEYLLSSFIEQNPLEKLSSEEFTRWQDEFWDYGMRRTDNASWALLQDKRLDGEEDVTKWGDFSSFYDTVIKLLPTQTQIDILEDELQNLQTDYDREVNKNGELSSNAQQYSTQISEVISEIEQVKKLAADNSVKLADEIAKADADYTSQLSTHIENLSSKQDELQDAYDGIVKNGYLDLNSDTAKELLKIYPDLIKYSDEYTNTLNIPASVLQDYFSETKKSALDTILASKKEIETALSSLESFGDIENNAEHKKAYETLTEQKELLSAQEQYIHNWSLATGNIEEFTSAMEKSADLSDKFETLSEATKSLSSIDLNNTQWLTDWEEALTAMKNAYPNNTELEQAIRNYKDNATEENARAVVEIYNDLYQKDIDNYNAWLDAKAGANTWDDFISQNTTFVEDFKELYGIDLLNYASYQEAKAKLFYDWAKAEAGGYEYIPTADREILKKRFDKEGLEGLLDEVFGNYNSPYSPTALDSEGDDDWLSEQKEKYKEDLAAEEDRYKRGIISYEEYLINRKKLLDDYFPAGETTEGDEFREEQLNDIDWDERYSEAMDSWDNENNYDANDPNKVLERAKAQRKLAEEMFQSETSQYHSPALFTQYVTEAAESEKEALQLLLERGIIEYDDFFQRIQEIRNQYTDADGNYIIPISFVTDVKDLEKQIEDNLEKWQNDNDYDENDVTSRRAYSVAWRQEVENSDYNDENSADYNPAKVEEKLKEIDEYEAETEAMALEQTRNAVQELYDEKKRQFEEENEALDEINEKEQRRLDIVKARIDLENAKKNRNQLVFANGSYYYDYDQEALRNAEEKYQDAVKADEDAKRQEAQDAELNVYETIIDALDELGDDSVSAIDAKTLSDALTDYKDDGKISDDNLVEMQKILGEDSTLLKEMKDGTLSMNADQIREIIRGMTTSNAGQSVISTEEQEKINQAVSEVANNIYNNSITIGNIVNNVTMPEGTTQQQVQALIDGFASEVIDDLKSLSTKIN